MGIVTNASIDPPDRLPDNIPMQHAGSWRRVLIRATALWLLLASVSAGPLSAQIAPSRSEIEAYRGLHAAAQRGDLLELNRLIAQGASLSSRDGHGRSAVHVASYAAQHDVIRTLARAGADLQLLEHDRYDGVTIAAVANDEATLRLLLSLGASARLITSRYDGTALIAAAHLGHAGVVRQLVAAGAPLDHVNNLHWTALIESIVLGDGGPRHQATLRILIEAGASLQLGDRRGLTPLALAKERGFQEMVRMLERAGAR